MWMSIFVDYVIFETILQTTKTITEETIIKPDGEKIVNRKETVTSGEDKKHAGSAVTVSGCEGLSATIIVIEIYLYVLHDIHSVFNNLNTLYIILKFCWFVYVSYFEYDQLFLFHAGTAVSTNRPTST